MAYYGTLLTFHILGGGLALMTVAVAILSKVIHSDHRWHVYSGRLYHYGMIIVWATLGRLGRFGTDGVYEYGYGSVWPLSLNHWL